MNEQKNDPTESQLEPSDEERNEPAPETRAIRDDEEWGMLISPTDASFGACTSKEAYEYSRPLIEKGEKEQVDGIARALENMNPDERRDWREGYEIALHSEVNRKGWMQYIRSKRKKGK